VVIISTIIKKRRLIDMNYRMYFYPAVIFDSEMMMQKQFKTKEEAFAAKNACAELKAYLHLMEDYSNLAGVEEIIDGEWQEIEEEE